MPEINENEKNPAETGAENPAGGSAEYIAAMKKIKENSVPKEQYDKIVQEKKQLLEALTSGETIEREEEQPKRSLDEIRDDLFNHEHSNLEYCELSLELRDRCIEEGEGDPFVPQGHKVVPTDIEYEAADRLARNLKECIDYAQGDSALFTQELQRRTVDTAPISSNKPTGRKVIR